AIRGIFSLPLELHANISQFAAPSSLIALSKTCHTAYRTYKPLHLERLAYLARISIAHASAISIEHELNEADMSSAIDEYFYEQLVYKLAHKAPIHVVTEFFDKLGWNVKQHLSRNHTDYLADVADVNEIYNSNKLSPYIALLPLQ